MVENAIATPTTFHPLMEFFVGGGGLVVVGKGFVGGGGIMGGVVRGEFPSGFMGSGVSSREIMSANGGGGGWLLENCR